MQYVTKDDGVSLAYAKFGSGPHGHYPVSGRRSVVAGNETLFTEIDALARRIILLLDELDW